MLGEEEGHCHARQTPSSGTPLLCHSKPLSPGLANLSFHPPRTGQLFTVQLQCVFSQHFFSFKPPFIKLSDLYKLKKKKSQRLHHFGQRKTPFFSLSIATSTMVAHKIKFPLRSYLRGGKNHKETHQATWQMLVMCSAAPASCGHALLPVT